MSSSMNRPQHSRDEKARQGFARALRRHVLTSMAGELRREYDDAVEPSYRRDHGAAPADGPTIHKLMKPTRAFRAYSAMRVNAQEMVYASVIPGIEREQTALNDAAEELRKARDIGSLELDPTIDVPRNVTAIDVHRMPGCYDTEYAGNDMIPGTIYDEAMDIFSFGQFGKDADDIGQTFANYARLAYPDFAPQRILDCGCTIGHNTLPWARVFPDAEVHAIDVAAPVLRYASTRAKDAGVAVHFKQMDATALSYDDASFDVVFSSMFLHELPLADIRGYLAEAFRVLRPGGMLVNMELPPNAAMGPYEGFYLDWDCYYNNEPFYKTFRDQDYRELITTAGFAADKFFDVTLPRYSFVGEETFKEALSAPRTFDSQTGRMDPKGTRWYGFGAIKQESDA